MLPKSVVMIGIKFLLVISMPIQPLSSRELRISSPKVNFLDILITSPSTFKKKVWGQDGRICSLIFRVNRLKSENGYVEYGQDLKKNVLNG